MNKYTGSYCPRKEDPFFFSKQNKKTATLNVSVVKIC